MPRYQSGLDVVVVNHQTPEDLQRFLDSFDRYGPTELHHWSLAISNVEPTNEDGRVALQYVDSKPNVIAYAHPENVGYGRAVNRAVNGGVNDTIAIFNADVELTEDALYNCWFEMLDCDYDILGPLQVDRMGRVTHAGILGTNSSPQMRGWRSHLVEPYRDVKPAISVSGSAYFIRRDVWDVLSRCPIQRDLGYTDGAFLPTPLYYEETWCSYHARAHDFNVIYYGHVEMIHEWHQSVLKTGEAKAMEKMKIAREMFREACDVHGIEHD